MIGGNDMNKNEDVKNLAQSVLKEHQTKKQGRQFILWNPGVGRGRRSGLARDQAFE